VVQRHALYLPQLYARDGCVPSSRPVDVVLVVDTSSSMTPDKLALARSAASGFVDLLALPRDRGAIVAFDSEARTVQMLTTDRSALHTALGSLSTSVGTRIDLGLGEGLAAVAGVDARAGADPVLVLLTDGRPDGGTHQQVLTMAELARDLGVVVYTIGLGEDVDAELLKEVAGQHDRYFPAPTAADLARIYGAVAKRIPCR
jgi:Ca-activated chloride channel family protein